MMNRPEYVAIEGDVAAIVARVLPLCRATIPGFADDDLLERIVNVRDPLLLLATAAGRNVGFKLGYRRDPRVFYSWFGGVLPEARRSGIASELMRAQHRHLAASGNDFIATRCRSSNNPMLILNLRHGFNVIGMEVDAEKGPVVLLSKDIRAS